MEEEAKSLEMLMAEAVEELRLLQQVERLIYFFIFGAAGLLFVGLYPIPYVFDATTIDENLYTVCIVFGTFCSSSQVVIS
jgi:hypothetical protein